MFPYLPCDYQATYPAITLQLNCYLPMDTHIHMHIILMYIYIFFVFILMELL